MKGMLLLEKEMKATLKQKLINDGLLWSSKYQTMQSEDLKRKFMTDFDISRYSLRSLIRFAASVKRIQVCLTTFWFSIEADIEKRIKLVLWELLLKETEKKN